MQAEISDLLTHRSIDRICPSYGCSIERPALVAALLQNTVVALQALSSRPRVRRTEGFLADRVRLLFPPAGKRKPNHAAARLSLIDGSDADRWRHQHITRGN